MSIPEKTNRKEELLTGDGDVEKVGFKQAHRILHT